ncbi:MAG: hypothetical protein IJQ12_07315 [Lachnospiraceae bacterium]|nr:hypothetical protein [Lachnospiraceae bacterium]
MKLKMYLIGLGMGVIVTAVIMGIALSGRVREMTDEEILARARQLGMVEAGRLTETPDNGNTTYLLTQNETVDTTAENTAVMAPADQSTASSLVITGEEDDTEAAAAQQETGSQADTSGGEGTSADGAGTQGQERETATQNAAQTPAQPANGTDTGTDARTDGGTQTVPAQGNAGNANAQNVQGASQENTPVTGSIVVTIPDASSSEEICTLLETAGVIDNANAFNNYLIQNGRDRYISTGAKLIPRGSSYEDVSRILTGR